MKGSFKKVSALVLALMMILSSFVIIPVSAADPDPATCEHNYEWVNDTPPVCFPWCKARGMHEVP